ncbi:MAG: DUF368 domain-containing protein [Clostridia bacterium]|nr:DUF368 domain-containing protein [Clostridia bacterium]
MAKGASIGLAMIIPGVSGGTLAVLLGVYDKIIDSIGNLFKDFKKSVAFLLPILLGAVLAFAALYFPLKYALKYAPFPTIMLFAGFMAGSCPDLYKKANKNGFKKRDIAAIIIPCLLVIGICFIPSIGDVNLSASMPVSGYFILLLIGAVASCALVVPGISGSMLLLIFGYYNPLLNTISALKDNFGHSLLVLFTFAVGLVFGFFTIAKLMQLLLKKFKRVTFWAITGFVIGSIPAVIITFFKQYGDNPSLYLTPLQISLGVILFVAGAIGTYFLASYAVKHTAQLQSAAERETPPPEPIEAESEKSPAETNDNDGQ